jgi:hypothetical protein
VAFRFRRHESVGLRTSRIIWSPKLFRTDSAMGGRTQAGTGECSYISIVPKKKEEKEKEQEKQREREIR